MKRTNESIISAIITADWHLRLDTPVSRTDDYQEAQWRKVKYVADLQRKYNCPVYHAGDLFHHWKPSPELLAKTIEMLPDNFWTVYGNHDLPQHNIEQAYKSGIYTLVAAGRINVFSGGHWLGNMFTFEVENCKVGITHEFTYVGGLPWPGCTARTAREIMKANPELDLIITGDNHASFTTGYGNTTLVNPGSLMRMTVGQEAFHPSVYLWNAKNNSLKRELLPITAGVLTRAHLDRVEQRNERLNAFVARLESDWEVGVSFEENMKRFLDVNNIRQSVKEIIQECIEN